MPIEINTDVNNNINIDVAATQTQATIDIQSDPTILASIGTTPLFGPTGNGIETIAKTGTDGIVDTYTIYYTNGNTTTFNVTNGDSIASIEKTSTSGLVDTYTITLDSGDTYTFTVTNGSKGDKGDKGETGATGNGIASIEKTSTSGLVDTYTVTYTDGTTTTFTVTNGADGQDGTDGISPTAEVTPTSTGATITITDANGTTTADITNGSDADVTSTNVINALGYTPYDASNPNGYTTNVGTVTSVNNETPDVNGNVNLTLPTNHVTTDTAQNITATKTFKAPQNFQDGSASGCIVIGADALATTVTAGVRKLGRMTFHTKGSTTLNCAFVSTDTQEGGTVSTDLNQVEFGGRPQDVTATSPDRITFTVAKTHNTTTISEKMVVAQYDKNAVSFYAQPKYNSTNLALTSDIGNATLTVQKNGVTVDTFTANATSNKTINITVPTTASDINALPSSTKYATNLSMTINNSTYVVTAQLKDQDGNDLGTAQTIDLPLESVVVNGSYDSTNKKIVLTLQSGSTIDVPVGDLVAGLQTEITSSNKLDADLVDDNTSTNKFVTSAEKTTWNGKQDAGNYMTTDTVQTIDTAAIKTFNGRVNFLGSGDTNAVYLSTNTRFDVYGTTNTVLGFASGTFLINNAAYNLNLRGKGTRPLYNGTNSFAFTTDIPTDTSDLTNNAGFITSSALSGYATESWVGNQGYITGITSSDVTTALGYTPQTQATYDSTNEMLIL